MAKAMVVHQPGGPEVMQWQEWDVYEPEGDEVLVKHTAVGMNFIDAYQRSGLYPMPAPFVPGVEACGIIIRAGENVHGWEAGDRVAYGLGTPGAYSRFRTIEQQFLARVPDEISDVQAAGMMTKGLTAYCLTHFTYRVIEGSRVLVYAAAGGTGLFLCQWARYLGAQVIGLVGSDEKKAIAEENGCHHVINYRTQDIVGEVMKITHGEGVNVVYDSVGQDTILTSLKCLAPFGLLVSFGQSSGKPEPLDIGLLRNGSLYVVRPSLFDYLKSPLRYQEAVTVLYDMVMRRHLRVNVMQTYDMENAVQAHKDMEAAKTVGSSVFLFGS